VSTGYARYIFINNLIDFGHMSAGNAAADILEQSRIVTALLTGHGPFRAHLGKMGYADNAAPE